MKLQQALALCKRVTRGTHVIPILEYVLYKDGYLHATNLEQFIKVKVDDVSTDEFCVQPKWLDILNEIPEYLVVRKDNNLVIETANGNYKVPISPDGASVSEYPKFPDVDGIEIPFSSDLISTITEASLFVSNDSTFNQLFNNVIINVDDDVLDVIATDSHVLYRASYPYEGNPFLAKMSKIFIDILSKIKQNGKLIAGDVLTFLFGDIQISERQMEGELPNISGVFNNEVVESVNVNPQEMYKCLLPLRNYVSDSKLLVIRSDNNKIHLVAENIDYNAKADVFVNVKATEFNVGVNIDYITNIMKIFNDVEYVQMDYSGSDKPLLISNDNRNVLVMPIKVG